MCIAPCLQKAVTLVIDILWPSSSPDEIVENVGVLKGYKISS